MFLIIVLSIITLAILFFMRNDIADHFRLKKKHRITQEFCNLLPEKCRYYNYTLSGKIAIDDRGTAHFTLVENSNAKTTYYCGFNYNPYQGYWFLNIVAPKPNVYADLLEGLPRFDDKFFQALFQRLEWCMLSQYTYIRDLTVVPLYINQNEFIGFEAYLNHSLYYITLQDLKSIGFPLYSKFSGYKFGLPSSDLKLEYTTVSSPHCYRSGSEILIEKNHQIQKFESNISNQPELIKKIMWTYVNYHAKIEQMPD